MKISVPREEIETIMHDYNCSEEEAAKAYLDAQERSNETFKSFMESKFGPQKTRDGNIVPKVYTPREIKRHLDKYIIGQEEYKKRLAIAASYPIMYLSKWRLITLGVYTLGTILPSLDFWGPNFDSIKDLNASLDRS